MTFIVELRASLNNDESSKFNCGLIVHELDSSTHVGFWLKPRVKNFLVLRLFFWDRTFVFYCNVSHLLYFLTNGKISIIVPGTTSSSKIITTPIYVVSSAKTSMSLANTKLDWFDGAVETLKTVLSSVANNPILREKGLYKSECVFFKHTRQHEILSLDSGELCWRLSSYELVDIVQAPLAGLLPRLSQLVSSPQAADLLGLDDNVTSLYFDESLVLVPLSAIFINMSA